jgi:multiple sugar transport system substrate-binding protein
MKKNKFAAIMAGVLAGTLTLGGCGETDNTSKTSSENKPSKITIAARGGSHVDVMKSVQEQFEKDNNVKIEILGLQSDDLKQKISLDSKNKVGAYDLIMMDDPWMPEFCEANILENLTSLGVKEDSDFIKQSLDIGKYPYGAGPLYALPFSGNVQFLFYNKAALQKAGAKVPTTWEEVYGTSKTAKEKGTELGYVIRGEQGNPIVSDFLPILWAYGGDVFDKNFKVTINSEEAKKALNMYMDLLETGANYNQSDIVSSVSSGKSAMSLGWPSWYIAGSDAKAEYAPIPAKVNNSSKENATGMIGNWMMGVTKNSANKEMAAKFLQYVTSADAQKKGIEVGGVPTRISVCNDAELAKKYAYLPTLLKATQNSVVRPRTVKWSAVEKVFGAELSAAVAKTKTIDQALADASKSIDAAMK